MAKGFGSVVLAVAIGLVTGCTNNNDTASPRLIHTPFGSFDPLTESLPDLALSTAPSARTAKIVQFTGRINAAWRAEVRAAGAEVRGYMPEDALVVIATAAQVEAIKALSFVRAVVDQPRLLKIDRRLVRVEQQGAKLLSMRPMEDLVVEMSSPSARVSVEKAIRKAGGTVTSRAMPLAYAPQKILRVRMPVSGVDALAAHPDVLAVDLYFAPKLFNDRSYGVVQGGGGRDKSPLWDRGLHGKNQIVAVADTGLYEQSCFFNSGEKVAGYEDLAGTGDGDGHGHGTHVAGSIAGDNHANGIYDRDDGMAPAAQLYIQDVADGGDLLGLSEDLEPMFGTAYDAGARIHSDSWGDEDNSYSVIARSVDTFVAKHPDFLILFANGNSGDYGAGTVGSPATAKNIISVGALEGMSPDNMAWFSSQGPTADGRIKPTLSAPGYYVVSAKNSGECATRSMSGTSMATPTLAGASALVREYFTDGFYPTGKATRKNTMNPSAALLKAVMLVGADDMTGMATGGHFPSHGQGFGRAHLANGLAFDGEKKSLEVHDVSGGLETGDIAEYSVTLRKGDSLRVALSWTDPPAEPGSAGVLVNDLDLVVSGPDGSYHGNLFQDGKSALQEGTDSLNVEEVVNLADAPAGVYSVSVRGTNVPMGPQAFAVAIVSK